MSALSRIFFEAGIRQGWLKKDESGESVRRREGPVVLAVSGGGDSMALLWLFRTFYEGEIIVAHLEHGIRGEESEEDMRFVQETARRWGLESEVRRVDVPGLLEKGESLETGARRMRYAFLESVAKERGAWGVALGHNKEDAAETVLFNLLRGAGVRGVAGMPERRGIFFRPLLRCSRDFLRAILRYRGIPWREDRTNADDAYTRNFLRNQLIPLVERKLNAKVIDHLVAFAEEMGYYRQEEESRGAALLETLKTDSGSWDNGKNGSIDREKAQALSLRERVLLVRAMGRRLEISTLSRERGENLALLMTGTKRFEFQWGGNISVLGSRDRINWVRRQGRESIGE
ncbi:MAG: tRNA lysidine(34) synthetase TilS [Synergistaceae bacterium]|nr:tRNA lysidine(34) synthetase TilS [Synergistaceae bacterium]